MILNKQKHNKFELKMKWTELFWENVDKNSL